MRFKFWGEDMSQSPVGQSGKVGWVATLMKQLLLEVRVAPVGQMARTRVAEIHGRSIGRLEQRLARDVIEELKGIAVPFCGLKCFETGLSVPRGSSFSRVNRLLDNIETAQLGRERQQQRRSAETGTGLQECADATVAFPPQRSEPMEGAAQPEVSPEPG
jgi:hypothetical protein